MWSGDRAVKAGCGPGVLRRHVSSHGWIPPLRRAIILRAPPRRRGTRMDLLVANPGGMDDEFILRICWWTALPVHVMALLLTASISS
jgi:hypothetical protein